MIERSRSGGIDPRIRHEVVKFLREWLPPEAKRQYRAMILQNPSTWSNDPHFHNGIIVDHALRGNGIDERALGIENLDQVWPELLREAVEDQGDAE